MDEGHLRKLRNLVSTCPKPSLSWSEQAASSSADNQTRLESTRRLVTDFLQLVAGGDDVSRVLDDVLTPKQKDELPALGSLGDNSGSKRLTKLNSLLKKSPPLKPWSITRAKNDSTIRLEVELTARRSLAYLSGGQSLALLEDILYPNEKEAFCVKYRSALIRVGDAVHRSLPPKAKAVVLAAFRQAGFTKEDLRELEWTFSNNLWNAGNLQGGLSVDDLTSATRFPSPSSGVGFKAAPIPGTRTTYYNYNVN